MRCISRTHPHWTVPTIWQSPTHGHKIGVIKTLTCRANIIVTKKKDKEEEFRHTKKVLSIAGYSKWERTFTSLSLPVGPHPAQRTCYPTLWGAITEPMRRVIMKAGVETHVTIRSILDAPRTMTMWRINVEWYSISYVKCQREISKLGSKNIRETRPWLDITCASININFKQRKSKQRERESCWFQRGVTEAL